MLLSSCLFGNFNFAMGQEPSISDDDATVVYPASYFAQYQRLSVSDILDQIPGINVARQGIGNQGGPGISQGSSRRGLGLGGDPFLNIERPLQRQGKGSYRYGFRYDMGKRNISYKIPRDILNRLRKDHHVLPRQKI